MKYQALYRKYRPKNFNEVVGQNITMKILKNAITNDHISHAYLFYGPRGTGKTSIAKIFARTINCDNHKNAIPCEECDSCLYSSNPGCPDIIEIDAASNNGVDEIRELKSKISFTPSELKYKVYIVDEVHMLSTGAFNALLKTLEEPPEHAIFILATTELQKVPLTIISRCQTLEFRKIDDTSMKNKLNEIAKKENIKISDDGISEIIKNSNGGLRDAIGLLEKAYSYESIIDENVIREISGNIPDSELKEIINLFDLKKLDLLLEKINEYYDAGIDLIKLGNNIIDYLRNQMITNKEYNKDYCKFIIDLDETIGKMEKSENPKVLFEVTLINSLNDSNDPEKNINNIKHDSKIIEQKIEQNNQDEIKKENEEKKQTKKEDNTDLKNIRVGNTLCNPQKNIIADIRNNWKNINDLAFDEDLGNIARILSSDVMPVAASDTNIVLISKLIGIANQINSEIDVTEKIINKTFDKEYKIICLSKDEWDKYTLEYKNDKTKFKYQEEEKKEKKNTLKEKAKELFD